MKRKDIEARILALPGIERLNAMQKKMLESTEPAITLIAPTGSGKTLAFATRLFADIPETHGEVNAVVIAPSRELVMQTASVLRSVARGLKVTALYGGHSMQEEKASLSVLPSVIVATPGRLLDHLQRGNIEHLRPKVLVLDEYDKSLELGFADEMSRIAKRIGRPSTVILTSATSLDTLPDYVPVRKSVTFRSDTTEWNEDQTPDIEVFEVKSPERDKLSTLSALLRSLPSGKTIVFTAHRESAERVAEALRREGIDAGIYHGGMEQIDRTTAIDLLANGTFPVLVATDLASRGLDIDAVDNVIHYHLPENEQTWTHRNGRTARSGRSGKAFIIVSPGEVIPSYINNYEEFIPECDAASEGPEGSMETIRFSLGRKEKLSKGDIAGYLINQGGLQPDEIGMITVHDHHALAAVRRGTARKAIEHAGKNKIKGKSVRIGLLKRHT